MQTAPRTLRLRPQQPPQRSQGYCGRWRAGRSGAGLAWRLPPRGGPPSAPRSTCHLQRPRRVQGAERVAGAQAGPLHHVVVRAAEEPVLPQRELVPGDELAAAGHAAETLDVVHLGAGAHHEVVLAEADAALGAFDPVQPARGPGPGREGSTERGGHFRRALPPTQGRWQPRPQCPETLKSAFADKLGMGGWK